MSEICAPADIAASRRHGDLGVAVALKGRNLDRLPGNWNSLRSYDRPALRSISRYGSRVFLT